MLSQEKLPRVVRAYLSSRKLLRRTFNGLNGLHNGFYLGLFGCPELQALTEHHYNATKDGSREDVDYHSDNYNLSGLQNWEKQVIKRHFQGCSVILLGAAGGGREALALSEMGFAVHAFECNPQLVTSCRAFLKARGVEANVTLAEPGRLPAQLGMFDGAILGFGAYVHIIGRNRRVELLRGFKRHLKPGAPFLLSFFVETPTISRRIQSRLARIIRSIRRGEPVEVGDSIGYSFARTFTQDDVREELAEAGFDIVFYSDEGFGHAVGQA